MGYEKRANDLITTRKHIVKQYEDFWKHLSIQYFSHAYLHNYVRTLL